jgi:hypothetical protein
MLATVTVNTEHGSKTYTPERSSRASLSHIEKIGCTHLEKYEISIESHQAHKRLIAKIIIDGKTIGEFIVHPSEYPSDKLHLKGVPNKKGEFTFLAPGTSEFLAADLNKVADHLLGMIEIRISPEEYAPAPYEKGVTLGRGGTGLTGTNKQNFEQGDHFPVNCIHSEYHVFRLSHNPSEVTPIL